LHVCAHPLFLFRRPFQARQTRDVAHLLERYLCSSHRDSRQIVTFRTFHVRAVARGDSGAAMKEESPARCAAGAAAPAPAVSIEKCAKRPFLSVSRDSHCAAVATAGPLPSISFPPNCDKVLPM